MEVIMFINFFYALKNSDIPVNPSAFLTLHRALSSNQVCDLNDFYIVSRCILIKSERYFDAFDQVFAYYFYDNELPKMKEQELSQIMNEILNTWLKDPKMINSALNSSLLVS